MNASQTTVKTTCCYCGVGCGILATKDSWGRLTVKGDPENPANRGQLCSKGMNLHITAMDHKDRLEFPQMRRSRGAPLERVTWDEALDRIARVFRTLMTKLGPDSVAFYGSGQFLTEEYYILNKLVKGFIGTNNLDTNSRLCMSSAVAAYKMALGEDLVPVSYDDLDLADCFLVEGANPAWCHPILFRRMEARLEAHPQAKLIVVDPRKTQTAAVAHLHLALKPGTDVVLNNALARLLIEAGHEDRAFLADHTEGYEVLREHVMKTTISQAAALCDVPERDLRTAAGWIGESSGLMTLWAMGLNQSAVGVDKNLSLINLNLLTGKIGKPGSGPLSLTGQPNAMGGREVGGLSNLASAHRLLNNPQHRAEIARHWGVADVPSQPGLTAAEFFPALKDRRLRALWIACTDPLVSQPNAREVEEALRTAPFVVVQDMSSTHHGIEFADVVLPAATWLEKEGTMTNSDRRVSFLNKLLDAPGEALPDAEIFRRFAVKMGWGASFNYQSPAEIYDEHVRLTVGTNVDMGGLSHERLKNGPPLQWPVRGADDQGTPRLFTDGKFATASGRAKLFAIAFAERSEPVDDEFPLVLTTGRIRDQWHTMSRSGKVNRLGKHLPAPFLEIHPQDAKTRNLVDGQPVVVSGRRGSVQVTARVTGDIRTGVVFLPMHWGRSLGHDAHRANNVTSPVLDPISKEPDYKQAAVQVTAYVAPERSVVVVGAGAGATRFIQQYRERGLRGPITVIGREPQGFYNRVLLPEWIAGRLEWGDLDKLNASELAELDLKWAAGRNVVRVDRASRTVVDNEGEAYPWDILVLATGSRPHRPQEVPDKEGIFTLRTRQDAEALRARVNSESGVVIVGGGVLGLELADALNLLGCRVHIVHRGRKLMDRQLDDEAAHLLAQEVRDRGISVYFGDEVKSVGGKEAVESVRLASGTRLACDALVYAVGTTPNVELARDSGLEVGRAIVVNAFLQTSDPQIFALGEAAEWNGRSWGVTAGAEEQADACVQFLAGNLSGAYRGTVDVALLKMEGVTLVSMGIVDVQDGEDGYEVIVVRDRASRYYKKCVVRYDRLVGALFVGDKTEMVPFKTWIESGLELSDERKALLRTGAGSARKPARGRLVCTCTQVGEDDLRDEMAAGPCSAAQLGERTGAGTVCGSCRPDLKRFAASRQGQAV